MKAFVPYKKSIISVLAGFVLNFHIEKVKAFVLISIIFVLWRRDSASQYLKALEKFVHPANENFKTFHTKNVNESKRGAFPDFTFSEVKSLVSIYILSKV